MPKKTATPEARTETSPEEAAPTTSEATTAPLSHVVAGGLPRFNPHARPTTEEGMTSEATGPIRQTYESVQQEAKGPGVEEVIAAISRGAAEKAWCTRWEVDDSLRWNHERQ